jgi:hypothetical protein
VRREGKLSRREGKLSRGEGKLSRREGEPSRVRRAPTNTVTNVNRLVGARKAVRALLEGNCLKAEPFEIAFQLVESCSRAALSESCSKAV